MVTWVFFILENFMKIPDGGFHSHGDIPNSWMVYFMENPSKSLNDDSGNIPSGKRSQYDELENHHLLVRWSHYFYGPFSIAM